MFFRFVTNLICLSLAGLAFSQGQSWPEASVLPWQAPGIDRDSLSRWRPALEQAHKALTSQALTNAQNASVWLGAQRKNLTLNQSRALAGFKVGGSTVAVAQPVFWQPVLCAVADFVVVGLEGAFTNENLLTAGGHRALARKSWDDAVTRQTAPVLLSQTLLAVWQEVSGQPLATGRPGLKLGLALSREITRQDEGSGLCLNILLAHSLREKHTVTRFIGLHELMTLQRAIGDKTPLQRANRNFVVDWQLKGQNKLPLTATQSLRYGESVFGKSLPPPLVAEVVISPGEKLTLTPAENMLQALQQSANALTAGDQPRVAKINRAWVYLDRGRSWGLQMNDRLVSGSGDNMIKGHVVGFYGPEEKVVSPRGFPVEEGAIVFIRKGQTDTAVGQEFGPDPQTYPTPWPP